MRNCQGDIKELRPTILIAVPAIYEKIKHGIINNVNKSGSIKKALFNLAFKAKLDAMRAGKIIILYIPKQHDCSHLP